MTSSTPPPSRPPPGSRPLEQRGEQRSRMRYVAAAALLVLGGIVYSQIGDDAEDQERIAAELAAQEESLAAEAAAAAAAAEAEAAAAAHAEDAARRAEEEAASRAAEEEAAARAAEEEAADRAAEEEAALRVAEEAVAARAAEAAATWTVFNVVDGDTVDVRHADGTEERVRITGIDTPERGECNFGPASSAMQALVGGQEVVLSGGARDDRDRYDRILRYVDVDGVDAGLTLIEDGLAIARYDSRDGYGSHPRESAYVAADAATPQLACATPTSEPEPTPPSSVYYKNCDAARAAGAAPVLRGEPGYASHLDRDNDGIGCE